MKKSVSPAGRFLIGILIIFFAASFSIPALFLGGSPDYYTLAGAVCALILFGGFRPLCRMFRQDRILFVLSLSLVGLSILITVQGEKTFVSSLQFAIVLPLTMIGAFITVRLKTAAAAGLCALTGLLLMILPLCADIGFRTAESATALLLPGFCYLLTDRKQLAAVILGFSGTVLLLIAKDPAAAVIWSLTYLLLFWAFSGHPALLLGGFSAVVLAGFMARFLLPDLLTPSGFPSVLASHRPGWFGLEYTNPVFSEMIPVNTSLFPWIALRYGWIFAACVLVFYPVIILRISAIARASRTRFHGVLAMGTALLIGLTAIVSLLSDFGLWSVYGLSLPGLARNPFSVGSFLFLIGLSGGISWQNDRDLEEDAHIAALSD